jgi:hypothetical protein
MGIIIKLLITLSCLPTLLLASNITTEGNQLAAFYDTMDVEHHWLPGQHVNWRTGCSDTGRSDKTHCGAFVASACEQLGIYILRPPQHGQIHLASAQAAWLRRDGRKEGWFPVDNPIQAQLLANQGNVVVAVFESPNPDRPGHIVLIRPSTKSEASIQSEGPQIIQAGEENKNSTTLKDGFCHHKGAWISANQYAVLFFAHNLSPH